MGWVLKGSWQKLVVCRYEEEPARGVSSENIREGGLFLFYYSSSPYRGREEICRVSYLLSQLEHTLQLCKRG